MDTDKCCLAINEMNKLMNCWVNLSELFEDFTTEELDALTKDYPFEKSFDDYTVGIIDWIQTFKNTMEE